jgi:hypothetical protein
MIHMSVQNTYDPKMVTANFVDDPVDPGLMAKFVNAPAYSALHLGF